VKGILNIGLTLMLLICVATVLGYLAVRWVQSLDGNRTISSGR
jgi:hypothetical protein